MPALRKLLTSIIAISVVAGIAWASVPNGPQPSVGLYWYTSSDPTIGAGVSAPLAQLLVRQDNASLYYKSGPLATAWTLISGGGGGGGGTVTSVSCGTGLSCAPSPIVTAGTVSLNITPTTCGAGMAEISTASDGTSVCASFGSVTGTGTAPDLTAWSSGTAIGNYAGSSPAACNAGSAVTQPALSAAGALTATCSPVVSSIATGAVAQGFSSSTLSGAATGWLGSAGGCPAGQILEDTTGGSGGWGCVAIPAGTVTSGTLTANTLPKASAAANIVNSLLTDNATTLAYNLTAFTVNTSGSASFAGLLTPGAGITSTAGANSFGATAFSGGTTSFAGLTQFTGHVNSSGAAMNGTNISSCGGGSPAVAVRSTDFAGAVTEGTAATGCTITFKSTYTLVPNCVCSELGTGAVPVAVQCAATATTLVVGNVSASGLAFSWICFGQSGGT